MLSKGTIVAGYELLQPLGPRSRSGIVYDAIDVAGSRRVAVKVLDADLSDDDGFRDRFREEVIKQGSLKHDHVLAVYEAGESQHGLFVAMAKVDGPSLRGLLSAGELGAATGLEILEPVAGAIDAAHQQGLVHRNVKPENILVAPDATGAGRHPLLGDFGSSRPLDGRMLGKVRGRDGEYNYISPEQARGEGDTTRSDIYALGAVLFEALVGSVPYARDSAKAVLYAHLYRPVPVASERNRQLPEQIDAVIQQAMAKDPTERYATGRELMAAAREALAHGGRAVAPAPARPRSADGPQRGNGSSSGPQRTDERARHGASVAAVAASVGGARSAAVDAPPAPPARPSRGPLPPAAATAPPTEAAPRETRRTAAAPPSVRPAPNSRRARHAPEAAMPARADAPPRRVTKVTTRTAEPSDRRVFGGVSRGVLVGLLALLALAGAALASTLLGGSGQGDAPPPPPRAEAGRQLGLTVPGQWQRLRTAPRVPGLRIADVIAVAPPGGTGAALLAGRIEASGPVLLPAPLLRRLADPPANDDTVALGQLQAYRYAGLAPRGFNGRINVYSVPTTAGVASVACVSPARAEEFLAACERVASTLKLSRGEPVPLGPDRRYAARLDRTIGRLNRARAAGRSRLQGARTPAGQARTAGGLAAAYREAATSLARGRVLNPAEQQANRQIIAALRTTQAAYTRMAAGARGADRGRYNAARAAVVRGEAAVQRGVESLEPLGYLLT